MFITKEDFGSSIYSEILDALTREEDTTATIDEWSAIAVGEMASYLGVRFDVDQLFSATGSSRNNYLVGLCKDITLYHIHSKGDPNQMPDLRVKRYDDAITALKELRDGERILPGAPKIEDEQGGSNQLSYGSNARRNNHY